jgi:hypothetical protein
LLKILKSADIIITKELAQKIKTNEYFDSSELQQMESLYDSNDNSGDWDNLIDYLLSINILDNKFDTFEKYILDNITNYQVCLEACKIATCFNIKYRERIVSLLKQMYEKIPDDKSIFAEVFDYLKNQEIIMDLVYYCIDLSNSLSVIIMSEFCSKITDKIKIIKLMSNRYVWNIGDLQYINSKSEIKYYNKSTIDVSNEEFVHNWFISRLCKFAHESFRDIVRIATKEYHVVKFNDIKYLEKVKEFDENIYESFKFRLGEFTLYCNYNENMVYSGCERFLGSKLFIPINNLMLKQ